MWALLSRRLRMWLIIAIGVPLVDWSLGKLSDVIRARRGDSRVTRGIDTTRNGVRGLRKRKR